MLCYECSLSDTRVEAVGVCQHCSAGLCAAHSHVELETVKLTRANPVYGTVRETVALPVPARRFLCEICWRALHHQPGNPSSQEFVTEVHQQ
ncbi:MAG: DUF2180 family protein [bacterium]|nr:DUF2180 family protein [bacterium]